MKKFLNYGFLALISLSLLVGCGNKPESTETNGEDTKTEEKTLTLLMDNNVSSAGLEAVSELAKEKLGITVDIETRPGGSEGDNIVKTRLASGDMADIVLYNSGALLSALNPSEYFIDISGEDFYKRIDDNFVDTVTIDDATYGIPFASSQAEGILYNKKLYEKYNLEVPKTWDEFMENCKVLKDAGETAIIGSFADSWTAQIIFLGDNYNLLAEEPNFPEEFEAGNMKYATTKAGVASFEKLAQTYGYYNEDYLATTYDDACDMLVNQEGAHWPMLSQALSSIYELYGDDVDDIGVFGIPGDDPDNHGLTLWMPSALYGNKNSDNIDTILEFMEFYLSDEALDAYAAAIRPDGPYCVKDYKLPDNAYEAVSNDMLEYIDAGKTEVALEFQTPVKGANAEFICQEVASGQIDAQEAAEKYDEDCLKQAVQLGLDW